MGLPSGEVAMHVGDPGLDRCVNFEPVKLPRATVGQLIRYTCVVEEGTETLSKP
jgi:hypothetical protein